MAFHSRPDLAERTFSHFTVAWCDCILQQGEPATATVKGSAVPYAQFLKLLLALGPKLPQVMALVQHIVSDVQELIALVKGTPALFGADSLELNAAEQCDEDAVLAALGGANEGTFGAIGDGTFLRAICQFVKNNPELLQLILSLLK